MKKIGDLVHIDPSYGVDAFVVRNDLLPIPDDGVNSIEEGCVIHARIEPDWQKYSKVSL